MDKIISAITEDGSIACYVIDSSGFVSRAERIHRTSAVVTAALGRLLTGTSLMAYQMLKDEQTVTIRIQADGPIGNLVAVSDADGNVRGYADHPVVELPLNEKGKLDVGGAVGSQGVFQVLRDTGGAGSEPFTGSVPLVSGEIAEDFTSYYAHSEQIPTAMALGVLVNPDLTVANAGGFLAQLLPGALEESIAQLEKNVAALPPITELYTAGKSPEDIMAMLLDGMEHNLLTDRSVEYRCNCSRQRVEQALISIGKKDLIEMADEQELTEVDCHFCPKIYRFNKAELYTLAESTHTDVE